ncbi:polysaccharide biosynthesis/export family protein [Elizabethkingia sp. JS20170427COW]|uniref:polysaccharide biosynthesis/export family protein n=1 Tax=Elizabethkingia sp. JS20170427COW TaxID=2583851 RepID=UPI001110A067|nr:polysaccharide biosynthesis/export family protein [Elizabethkingia sp. JS20170427COW]QCX53666.1 polysaccharide export protein [Elizabethkingia sp. JS20170427COW]
MSEKLLKLQIGKLFFLLLTFALLSSCKTKNDITYMQNIDEKAVEIFNKNASTLLQSGDRLVIEVSGADQDVVSPFNQNYSSSDVIRYNNSITNSTISTQKSTVSGPTYIVNSQGDIDFPIIGKVSVKGETIEQVQEKLIKRVLKYVKNPTINIKLANFKVSVLGEVSKPGQYIIPDGEATLLNALAMAGDATIYGLRTNVLIIRNNDGQIEKQRVDITNADFINSPYYHLKQNDVIYISPNKTRQASSIFGQQTSVFISITSILVTIIALIVRK